MPPVPSLGRRVLVAGLVLAAAVGLTWLVVVGRVVPRLQVDGQAISAVADQGPIELRVGLTNGGQRDIELRSAVVTIDGVAVPGIGVRLVDEVQAPVSDLAEVAPFVLPAHSRSELSVTVVPTACGSSDVSERGEIVFDADLELTYAFTGFPSFERTSRVADVFAGSAIVCS